MISTNVDFITEYGGIFLHVATYARPYGEIRAVFADGYVPDTLRHMNVKREGQRRYAHYN